MLCAKFGWNWPNDSGEEDFLKVISLFFNYLPLEKGEAIHLNKLESHWPNDVLCHVWLKLAQWVWRRRFSNFVNTFSLFCYHLLVRHLDKLKSPSPKDGLYQVWLKLVPWFWRKRRKCEKSTEKFWSEKLTWAFGSVELKKDITSSMDIVATIMGTNLKVIIP